MDSFDVTRVGDRVILSFRYSEDNPLFRHDSGADLDVAFDRGGLEILVALLAEALTDIDAGAGRPN